MRNYMYGEYLYNLRKSIGLSQGELGKMLGISNKAVSKWENGESKPAMKQMYSLSKIFGVSIEELMDIYESKKNSVTKIVITGGPCAGKSTALSLIQKEFSKRGYHVITISETATDVILSGYTYNNMTSALEFQKVVFGVQLSKEKTFENAVNKITVSDKILVICDRGLLDSKAYLSEIEFNQLLKSFGKNEVELRDNYDAVFHLVTAANGAEEYYTTANNSARIETLEEARIADKRTLSAWAGHPHLRVIDNKFNFNDKIKNLIAEISSFIGEPEPYEIERKFLIEMPDINKINNPTLKKLEIIQTYLKTTSPDTEIRIRQRGYNGDYVYTKTEKKKITGIKRIEIEKRISKDEYLNLLMDADTNIKQLRKTRYCFVYNNQYFELDIYPFWKDKAILEIELKNESDAIQIPEYITIIKEVTDDDSYKNINLTKLY